MPVHGLVRACAHVLLFQRAASTRASRVCEACVVRESARCARLCCSPTAVLAIRARTSAPSSVAPACRQAGCQRSATTLATSLALVLNDAEPQSGLHWALLRPRR